MQILCLGDSLTYGYGVATTDNWCSIASRLTGHEFINHGINGASTGDLVEMRLWGDAVFIMAGLNNLFTGMPISVALQDIRTLSTRARHAKILPLVGIPMSISHTVSEGWCDGPVDIQKVRKAYIQYAEELFLQCQQDGVLSLDFRPVINVEKDLSFDGIHLNRQGHQHMAEAIAASDLFSSKEFQERSFSSLLEKNVWR